MAFVQVCSFVHIQHIMHTKSCCQLQCATFLILLISMDNWVYCNLTEYELQQRHPVSLARLGTRMSNCMK